ncbi:MAG TPA: hypothetical protein VJ914_35470 [Pseudonocardiaceae bacterium]|nr:hypothetical protein [Pseudonocardiaceae bacterium]
MLGRIGTVATAVPVLFLAASPLAAAAPNDPVSLRTEQVTAPGLQICLLPILCITIGDGEPSSPPPPPPPPPTSPPPPTKPTTPTTPTRPPTSPPTTTHSVPPPSPPVTSAPPTSVALRAAVPPVVPVLTPTTSPPPPATLPPGTNPAATPGRVVLPTSANTLKAASVSPEVVTERRWALTAIVLIFGGGAVAAARMRRRTRD